MSTKTQLRLQISKSLKKLDVTFLTILWIMLSHHCMKEHDVMSESNLKYCWILQAKRDPQKRREDKDYNRRGSGNHEHSQSCNSI